MSRTRRWIVGTCCAAALAGCTTTATVEEEQPATPEELTFWQHTSNVVTWPFRAAGALVYYPVKFVFYDAWAGLYDLAAGDPELVTAFNEADDAARPEAARAAAAAGHRAIVPGLLAMLDSNDGGQRAAAVDALELLGAADLGNELLLRLAGAERVGPAIAYAEALGAVGAHDTWPALADAARSHARAPQRVGAIHALGRLRSPGARWALVAALDHDSAPVRQQAAWALGEVGDRRAAPFLLPRLEDGSAEVRAATAMSIGRLGDPTCGPRLVAMLQSNRGTGDAEEALVALAVAVACGRLQLRDAAPTLREMLDPPTDQWGEPERPWDAPCIAAAAQALGRLRDPAARPALARLLTHRDARVSRTAGLALGALAGMTELASALQNDQARTREAAAIGLGRVSDDRAITLLWESAAVDPDGTVRHAAALALLAQGDRRGLDLLVSELTRGGIQARAAALGVLEQISNEDYGLDAVRWREWRRAHGDAADLAPFRYREQAG